MGEDCSDATVYVALWGCEEDKGECKEQCEGSRGGGGR